MAGMQEAVPSSSLPSGAPRQKLSSLRSCKVDRERSLMMLMGTSLAIVLGAWPRRGPRGEDPLSPKQLCSERRCSPALRG